MGVTVTDTDMPELGTDPAEDAIASMAVFGRILTQVDDEHLELETPCDGWNVQALISHVVIGDAAVPLLFDGKALPGTMTIDTSLLGPNPVATWRGTALAAIEAFRTPGAMEQIVQHPIGERPGSVVARFRMIDQLGHAWDLATAIGVEVEIPDALADAALDFLLPMLDLLKDSKVFGAPVAPPEGSPAWIRFLGLLGRKAW
jgi:uncharacterized protein (TIGR03086 family)